jgi:glycosyltransferase-like protein
MAEVGLVTYSTKPRGGVVHTLALADALHRRSFEVQVIALGDPGMGFFKEVEAPCTFVPAPEPAPELEQRVADSVDALAAGLRQLGAGLPSILHVQDCIAARAAVRMRDEGMPVRVVRTVHHVDDFTTPALVECQRRSILDPDRVLVVSQTWQRQLARDFGVKATMVTNGVDVDRFAAAPPTTLVAELRARIGATDRFVVLSVGGIEPRKGTDHLFRALSLLRRRLSLPPVLAIIGGHSYQDHTSYRDDVIATMPGLDLEFDRDIVMLGTLPEREMPWWYHTADAFAFPSIKEGWGLALLEAMAAGTPTVVCDLPVFREYLKLGQDALAVAPGDDEGLASQLSALATDERLRHRLVAAGRRVARRYSWDQTAEQHLSIYDDECNQIGR